jgi:hypothetical protein
MTATSDLSTSNETLVAASAERTRGSTLRLVTASDVAGEGGRWGPSSAGGRRTLGTVLREVRHGRSQSTDREAHRARQRSDHCHREASR